jgi:hypothetical protein
MVAVSVTLTDGDTSLCFIDGSEALPAEAVFESVLQFWTTFIYRNGICKDDPLYE